MDAGAIKSFLFWFSDAVRFLTASPLRIAVLASAGALLFVLRVWGAARARSLACVAAGQSLGFGEATGIVFKELYSAILALAAALPAILAAVAASVALMAVADSLKGLDEMRANAARVRELSVVLQNLERRQKVLEVRVASVRDGVSSLSILFFDPSEPGGAVATQDVTIRGTEVYFDAIMSNFDYAEIAAGRRVNLAIPYRVFSDVTPQASGVALGLKDAAGVPYAYGRKDDDVFGLAPEAYRARLAELVHLMSDETSAREAGIVRSVYGSAVHRRVKPGDRFAVWVEQTGGLTIKDAGSF
ncbi:MAG: hypothetical protein E4H20_03010 [Spirochaetales bacterium]|nr:MAG: hypothetical protein E4H20_03010 [Spirochaetales bacterium]